MSRCKFIEVATFIYIHVSLRTNFLFKSMVTNTTLVFYGEKDECVISLIDVFCGERPWNWKLEPVNSAAEQWTWTRRRVKQMWRVLKSCPYLTKSYKTKDIVIKVPETKSIKFCLLKITMEADNYFASKRVRTDFFI